MNTDQNNLSFREFVLLMALMLSLVALSIDAMLSALPEIGRDLGVQRSNNSQLIISLLIFGMAVGQMIYGPLSDSTGRKPAVYAGFGLFIVGCLFSIFATSFSMMLIGRGLQGIGIAGPRIVTVAIVRDQYEGRAMARVMSFVMAVFILVPILAPAFGQIMLIVADWRAIFGALLALTVVVLTWFWLRQPETLTPNRRRPFSLKRIGLAIHEILGNRVSFGYTLTAGLIFGAFLGYLNSAQQIFQEQYGLGRLFPIFFGILAVSLGCASLANARLVMRFGMRRLATRALQLIGGLAVIFFTTAYLLDGHPPLWVLMIYFLLSYFCIGVLFGNLNALAMEPLGHIAGVGAAVVGSLSTLISVLLGTLIGQSYNGTVLPLVGGFAILSVVSLGVMQWVEHRKQVSQYG
jgi:DHA1 family bicyclomycin/chloramphenicol resistance-like MFS transporter